MKLIIKLLNDMAASHPEEIALTEQGHAISFAGLKHLVDTLGQQLFDDGTGIYGQHIRNKTSCRIFALCAEHAGVFSKLVSIPTAISKEGLSEALKTARIQVLYTDSMDGLLEAANSFGPFISLVTPIEFYHHKIWKVRFRSGRSSTRIDYEKVQLRRQKSQGSRSKKGVCA
jgi:hypothetical protein